MSEDFNLEEALVELLAEKKKQFEEPVQYDPAQENLVRELMSLVADYDEEGIRFDPSGRYLCGTCQMRIEPDLCSHVSGIISMEAGSCEKWMIGPQAWPVQIVQWTQKEANYGTRGKAKGFGCSRCGWGSEAKKADAEGRSVWCGRFGARVQSLACCCEESGSDWVASPGE